MYAAVAEGNWLAKTPSGAYAGSSYHNVPLLLALLEYAETLGFNLETVVQVSLIAMDVLSCVFLFLLPFAYRRTQSKEWSVVDISESFIKRRPSVAGAPSAMVTVESTSKVAELAPAPSARLPLFLAAFYMLNPFTIMCCVAMSLQLPLNLIVIATALFASWGSILFSSILLSLAIYMSPYLLVLALPTALLASGRARWRRLKVSIGLCVTLAWLANWFVVSYIYMNGIPDRLLEFNNNPGWTFLDRVYGFQFFVEDLQPNIGVSWYFHTEVFQHFRLLFLFVFQYHVFLYTIPVCYKFSKYPMTAFWLLLTIVSALKPYPSLGDVVLYISLFPIIWHLMDHMSYKTLIATAGVACACLFPVMWRMWIWTGTGNANFYFAICVGMAAMNGLFITDVMESVLIRDFLIKKALNEGVVAANVAPTASKSPEN